MINHRGKQYLLIPSVPTPNGGLHLGHIGGPYLSADILARYFRMQGAKALVVSGTDSFESYVSLQAERENLTQAQVCDRYHQHILDDLQTMKIKMDAFVNPLSSNGNADYAEWQYHIFQRLQNSGAVVPIQEKMPWDACKKRYIAGCWLHGTCPQCSVEITGYFCEKCGAHFRPEETGLNNEISYKCVTNQFLKLHDECQWSNTGISREIASLYGRYLTQQNGLLRLTVNSDWGLNYNEESTLFNYGLIYAYFLMFGEIAAQHLNQPGNAFSFDSPVQTIATFGIDNAIPFLASTLGITHVCREFKPFDYYIVNHFYLLEGSKFSTSRRHAIWANDFDGSEDLTIDCVRVYLSSINVREKQGNFIWDEFISCARRIQHCLEHVVIPGLNAASSIAMRTINPAMIRSLESALTTQSQAMHPAHYAPHVAAELIDEWMRNGEKIDGGDVSNLFWWIKGLSLLIYPIMPALGQTIWSVLGYAGIPDSTDYTKRPERQIQLPSLDKWSATNLDISLKRIRGGAMYEVDE